jgi:hypothetical protein
VRVRCIDLLKDEERTVGLGYNGTLCGHVRFSSQFETVLTEDVTDILKNLEKALEPD